MFEISTQKSYMRIRFKTAVNYDTVIKAVQAVVQHVNYRELNDIYIFDELPVFLNHEQLEKIVRYIEQVYPEGASRSKTALVINTGFGRVLAEMFIRLAHRLPPRIEIFTRFDDAEKWILSR